MILPKNFHTPVLLSQVITALKVEEGKKYIDATIGGGGYAIEILKCGGIVLGIDQDLDAINYIREKLEDGDWKLEEKKNLYLVHGNFADLKEIAHSKRFNKVSGIIFDLGMSTYQLEKSGRGFSYMRDEPLDMRMDKGGKLTAAEILNTWAREKLYEIFAKYAEELHSRAIADAIVRARALKKIATTRELAQLIDRVVERFHANATKARIFQALRIAVNNELENLQKCLREAVDLLGPGGRMVVLSYHSLEDRIVKLTFRREYQAGRLRPIEGEVKRAGQKEIKDNPRARSAKLRMAERSA